MTKAIRQSDALTPAEKQKLFEWADDIFEADHLKLRWRPKEVHFILEIDGEPVSHVGLVRHEVSVGDQAVMVGGVGGVVTIPSQQGQGHARELMTRAAEFFKQWDVKGGLLFCLPSRVQFYESQGWQLHKQPVIIQQPEGEKASPLEVMTLPVGDYRWPEGEIKLGSFPW